MNDGVSFCVARNVLLVSDPVATIQKDMKEELHPSSLRSAI